MSSNHTGDEQPPKGSAEAVPASGGGLSAMAIRRPVFTTMIMLGLVVMGIFSFRGLAIDQFPNVDIPIITVQTVYPGASPETIEREVTRRMEEAFNPVEGVDKITSQTLEGVSVVIVEFDLGRDADEASNDLRTKIEGIRRQLPDAIDPPLVQKFDPSSTPIISLALSSKTMPPVQLTSLADQTVRRQLETVSGVGEVRISGGLEREVRIYLEPQQLQALGITVNDVMRALQSQNLEVPAGRIERSNTEDLVRVTGRITNPAQFADVVVANRNGQPILLGAVAKVEDATEDQRSLALLDGSQAISLDILKVSGANTVDVADRVNKTVTDLKKTLPKDVEIQVVRDNSITIRHSVNDVIVELLIGALLTVVIVMLFLNDWKATAITSLALPVSVISSFILMNLLGFTLNILTLMALSLSIGILIDDAIVVVENIVRHREMGKDHFSAARIGTQEIILAVLATTLTIVAVFVPVSFMSGIIGRFFFQFGLTVAWAVLVSLFVSFTLTPMLSAWWGVDPHKPEDGVKSRNPLTRFISAFNRWFDRLAGGYRSIVAWALRHRKSTLGLAIASFIGAIMLFPLVGGEFSPASDNSELAVSFETPDGSTIGYTESKAREVITALKSLQQVSYTYTTIGSGQTGSVNRGNVYVKLIPAAERTVSQLQMLSVARAKLSSIYGANVSVLNAGGVGGAQAPISVQIRGTDIAELQRVSELALKTIAGIPGIVDVRSSVGNPRPEYRIDVDRALANDAGLDIGQIAAITRPLLAGSIATRWEDPTGEERDVVVQLPPSSRVSIDDIRALPLATARRDAAGVPVNVTLGQVAHVNQGTAPARIDRSNLQRTITISAGTTPGLSIAQASTLIRERLAKLDIPNGYTAELGGQTEQLEETMASVIQAILLAIILIFLILASQFESFTQPFAIMVSLPLALVGVLLALLITGDTVNMMSMIGLILLMGLVTKNAILLVDNANEQRSFGKERFEALVEAGAIRLRPIMMTTLAMVAGMIPSSLALGEGGGFRAPMARAVIGGLITSTILTLVVVPVAYTYFDDFGNWVKRKLVSKKRSEEIDREQGASGLAPEPVWVERT